MNRGDVGLVLGLAGFLLGGVAIYVAAGAQKETSGRWSDMKEMVASDDESIAGIGARLKELDESHKALSDRVNRLTTDPNKLWDVVHAMESRLQKLEAGGGVVRLVDVSKDPPPNSGPKDEPPKDKPK